MPGVPGGGAPFRRSVDWPLPMQATIETLEGNRVKLSVEVGEEEYSRALDEALAEVAKTIRLPGFRPGHAPKRVVEARIGKEALRQEVLRDELPTYIRQAASDTGIDPIGSPEIEVTSEIGDSVLRFDAVVETRPRPPIPGYAGLRVTVPGPLATDEEIDRQIDRMREQFGELTVVNRPARDGDYATIDVSAHHHAEAVGELSVEDFVYPVGSGNFIAGLDDQLRAAKAGDIFKFNAPHPAGGDEVSVQVLVKEIKEKVLPDANDAWAAEASEFASIAELRSDIATRIGEVKKVQARLALRSEAAKELSSLVDEDPPGVLVAEEMELRLTELMRRLQSQGATVDQYLAATGQDPQSFTDGLRAAAAETVKLDLGLRSLAEAESIAASDLEVDERIEALAGRAGQDPHKLRQLLDETHGLDAVRWEIRKAKALDWLEGHVEVVDEEGKQVDRALLEPPGESESPGAGEVGDGEGSDRPADEAEGSTLEQ